MKKCRLFIFSIVAFVASLFLTSNVFAYYVGEDVGTYVHDSGKRYNQQVVYNKYAIRWNGPDKKWYNKKDSSNKTDYTYYTTDTYYVSKNGVKQEMYCIDKHAHSGNQNASMVVQRVLDPKDPKDATVLKIISMPDSEYSYFAKVIAIRAFVGFISKDFGIVANEASCANINSGIAWLAEKDIKEDTAAVLGLANASSVTKDSLRKINGVKNFTATNKTVKANAKKAKKKHKYYCRELLALSMCNKSKCNTNKKAKELLKLGVKYGAEVARGNIPEPKSVTNRAFTVDKNLYETLKEGDKTYAVKTVNGSITFNNFNNGKDEPANIIITPDTKGVITGIKYEYQVAGTSDWIEFNSSYDFNKEVFQKLDKDKVTINIRIKVKAPTDKSQVTANFVIDVKYKDEAAITGALIKNSKNPYPNTQRYYIYEKTDIKYKRISAKLTFDVFVECDSNIPNKNDITAYKDYINTCCRGQNPREFSISKACNEAKAAGKTADIEKWCGLQAEYCAPCDTTIEVPNACTDFSEGNFEAGKTASIKGPTDIKVCVMDSYDEANNPYKLTKNVSVNGNKDYSFSDNKYCKVSCKEDYTFDLPTGRYVISGRYFELQMGVSATKTCYTDIIDYQAFRKDLAEQTNKLNGYITAGQATMLNKEFVKAYADYRKIITDIEACSLGWDNSYTKNPEISFDYDEEYIEKLLGKDLKFVPTEDKKTTETKWFCNGSDVDRTYTQCQNGKATETAPTEKIIIKECTTTNASTYNCKNVEKTVPTTRFAKVTTEFKATYSPESVFFTKYSTGVIDINKDGNNKYTKLDKYLDSKIDNDIKIKVAGLPVSLKDEKGVYNYNIKFDNVGEFFDQDEYGRLLGSKTSTTLANDKTKFEGTYVCSYVVNCPTCKVTCKEDPSKGILCQLDSSNEPQCVGTCAYDKGYGELYSVQQISVTNFNPTERTLGANLTTEKGQSLIQSITEKGESIYKEPEYSFTFTPAAISYLRNINASSENGYLGEAQGADMKCNLYSELMAEKYNSDKDMRNYYLSLKGTEKDYTICQSSVLDEIAKFGDPKAHSLVGRDNIQSWLDSDYCKNGSHICLLVGNLGPAWK